MKELEIAKGKYEERISNAREDLNECLYPLVDGDYPPGLSDPKH